MNLKELNEELKKYFLIRDIQLKESDIGLITTLMSEANYIQIFYKYDVDVLLVILELLEKNEFYEQCLVLKRTIENINKLEKENYPTNYR